MPHGLMNFLRNKLHCLTILNVVPDIPVGRSFEAGGLVRPCGVRRVVPRQTTGFHGGLGPWAKVWKSLLIEFDAGRMLATSVTAIDRIPTVDLLYAATPALRGERCGYLKIASS